LPLSCRTLGQLCYDSDCTASFRAEVIRLQMLKHGDRGKFARRFERPKVHYNYVQRDDTWWVSYEGKAVNDMTWVGNDFSVTIEDKTRKLWLITREMSDANASNKSLQPNGEPA